MPALFWFCRCGSDLQKLGIDVLGSASLCQYTVRLIKMSMPSEIAWRLRKGKHTCAEHYSGNRGKSEHPPPVAGSGKCVVCHVGNHDAYRNRKLVERYQPAPRIRGSDFRDVKR